MKLKNEFQFYTLLQNYIVKYCKTVCWSNIKSIFKSGWDFGYFNFKSNLIPSCIVIVQKTGRKVSSVKIASQPFFINLSLINAV